MSYNPTTIANYFISKYGTNDIDMTPMKVIKLTYISYCWYLALTGNKETLIDEKPQAWEFGPVFPSLYSSLKQYGRLTVTKPIPASVQENIYPEDARFLDKMWKMYGRHDGVYLSALTHKKDTPWSKVYVSGKNNIISDDSIYEHYSKLLIPAN